MYAVIVSGGKQHRVEEGEVLKLEKLEVATGCLLYTSPSPRDRSLSRMPSSA